MGKTMMSEEMPDCLKSLILSFQINYSSRLSCPPRQENPVCPTILFPAGDFHIELIFWNLKMLCIYELWLSSSSLNKSRA